MKSRLPPRCWATYPLPQVVDVREGGKEAVGAQHRLDSAETERNSSCPHNPLEMNLVKEGTMERAMEVAMEMEMEMEMEEVMGMEGEMEKEARQALLEALEVLEE